MSYEQTLYSVVEPVKKTTLSRMNRSKKWKRGYNKEHDLIVLSSDGQVGEIYDIQGLKIALPKPPKQAYSNEYNKWKQITKPDILKKIKTIFDWKSYPEENKEQWYDYIDEEFNRREQGFWFNNNGDPTYITGAHYMYLQWSKIDVGAPDFREANRLFFIFWEACKIDQRCYGMCYLKNRRSGFSFMSSAETVNQATISSDSRYGILSKSGSDAKKMFTDKVVPISINYPFFFKPIQDGMDRPKSELAYRVPASKFTRKKIDTNEKLEEIKGLDTTIDWKNTGDNSYDGEKLALLVHDESGKWERPDNILNNWRVTKTCLRLGSRIIGKCMMGSTSNALDKGGDNFKRLYNDSDVNKRNKKLGKKALKLLQEERAKQGLRGRTPIKQKVITESDWKDYFGSQKEIVTLSKEDNCSKNWEKRILEFVPNKKLLTYYETKYLFKNDVLENQYSAHINDNILGKFFRKDFD